MAEQTNKQTPKLKTTRIVIVLYEGNKKCKRHKNTQCTATSPLQNYLYRVSQITPTMLSILCRRANGLFFKTESLFGTARFRHCRASKCLFHMSSINQTCSELQVVYITNSVPPTSLQSLLHRRSWVSHTWPNKFSCLVRLSIALWTRAMRSSSDVTGIPYTILFILPHRK